MLLFKVELNNITAGVEVNNGIITNAASVFKKFLGTPFIKFKFWVESKGGYVGLVSSENNANEG